jgi:cell division septation protein DedD
MRLLLKRGAAVIAVIVGIGTGSLALHPLACAGEAEGRAALQAGDYDKAIAELKPLAEKGEAGSQYLLAETYFGGHGGTLMEGLKWMSAAADQGYAQAQARLGLIYATGRGVPVNNVEAYRWFSLAAKLADPRAQKNLKTVSETNRTVVSKRISGEQRAKIDAEVASWKPGAPAVETAAAAPAPAAAKIGEVVPGIRIQLAAVKKAEEAPKEWKRLKKTLGDQLSGLSLTVESVDLGAKGVFHRIQAGPFSDKAAAAAKCAAIKALNQECLVVVRK